MTLLSTVDARRPPGIGRWGAARIAAAPATLGQDGPGTNGLGAGKTNPAEMREDDHGRNSRAQADIERERRLDFARDAEREVSEA